MITEFRSFFGRHLGLDVWLDMLKQKYESVYTFYDNKN
jgi:hypothetical protein